VESSTLIRRLLGIFFCSFSCNKLALFFSIVLVWVRFMILRSLIYWEKASCCDKIRGRSGSSSGASVIELGDGLNASSRYLKLKK
jgi:uncharacterized membrane protein (DUF4010 family)